MKNTSLRFLDRGQKIYDFHDEFLVICPKCQSLGKVVPVSLQSSKTNSLLFAERRFICSRCVYRTNYTGGRISIGDNRDWYFRFPLWLQIPCCGQILWAYNLKHLQQLENYVSAKLRERTTKGRNSFLSKLPRWLKLAKNRQKILKCLKKMRTDVEKVSF